MTYGITTAVKPLTLSKKQLVDLVDKEYDYKNKFYYKEEETITTVCSLLQLLDVDKVLVTESGSKLDCHLKIDVAVKQGNSYIGFQVKSSQRSYDKYCDNYLNTRLASHGYGTTKDYQAPGCIWINRSTDTLRFLIEISKWLGIAIRDNTKDAIRKYKQCKKLKVMTLSSDIATLLNVNTTVVNVWVTLGIVKCDNGVISYLH